MGLLDGIVRWFGGEQVAEAALSASGPAYRSGNPEDPNTSLSQILDNIGGLSAQSTPASGVLVNPDTALRVSAVYSAVNTIAETIACMPRGLYKETERGKEKPKRHSLNKLYDSEPNDFQTWFQFMHSLVACALLRGNGYAYIRRDEAYRPVGLEFLAPGECMPMYQSTGLNKSLYYYVFGTVVPKRDIIHIPDLASDGIIGKSRITLHAESIGIALAAERFGASFYGNGANMSGVLTTDGKLSNDSYNRIRNDWRSRYRGVGNAHETVILEQGLKYERISIVPEDAQFIETRKFQVEDIARIFRVPPHKLADLSRSTNNNIEHQSIEFVTDTIVPWVERIEQEFDRKLLFESEKGQYWTEHDVSYLLRGDSKARAELIQAMFNTGAISPDEIRTENGLNKLGGPHAKTYLQAGFVEVGTNLTGKGEV